MRLRTPCTICTKPLDLASESPLSETETIRIYKCGHAFIGEKNVPTDTDCFAESDFASRDGRKSAFGYQREGVGFCHNTQFNCLIADPMGLGKTIQALLAAKTGGFKRILIIVKSATIYQWFQESKEWFDASLWSVFMIQGSKDFIPPGFSVYLMSMDTLGRFVSFNGRGECIRVDAKLQNLEFDLLIVDECHSFKNTEAKRSKSLVGFIQHSGIKHKILLSGTPIKNRADEYFVPLNILKPEIFTSLASFRRQWLEQDPNTGKWSRIRPRQYDEFQRMTAQFVIRREKNKVLSLPPFRRTFEHLFIEDETLKAQYNKALADLRHLADTAKGELTFWDIQENLMTLRRITGMAKVPFATEYIDTFLDTTENEKIAIGVHHEGVRDNLYYALDQRGFLPLKLSGEDTAERKNQIVTKFCRDESRRVLIINMLAGGVGLNLQACNNVLILERQWNAADEEQFEGRFNRHGQTLPVLAEYMIAKGTIDEYFSALVEKKRVICGETLDGWSFADDKLAVRELVDAVTQRRL